MESTQPKHWTNWDLVYRANGSQSHPTEPLICLRWQCMYAHFCSLPEVLWAEEVLRFLCLRMQNYDWKQLTYNWLGISGPLSWEMHSEDTHPYLFLRSVLKDTAILKLWCRLLNSRLLVQPNLVINICLCLHNKCHNAMFSFLKGYIYII